MSNLTPDQLITIFSISIFLLGTVILVAGILILFRKVMGGEVKMLADQTAKLGQKGITEGISGLVGNASSLLDALNNLIKTAAGIGIFLTITGVVLFVAAYYLVLQIR